MNWVDWKGWRKQAGLTQNDVTELMNLRGFKWHQSTIYKIETGQRDISFLEGLRLCAVYDVNIYEEIEKGK